MVSTNTLNSLSELVIPCGPQNFWTHVILGKTTPTAGEPSLFIHCDRPLVGSTSVYLRTDKSRPFDDNTCEPSNTYPSEHLIVFLFKPL